MLKGNKLCAAAIAAITAAAALSGCTIIPHTEAAKPELLKPVRVKVESLSVKRDTISDGIRGLAVVAPRTTEYYSFSIGGVLAKRHVLPGDRVKKGDPVLELNPGGLPLQILQQQLTLENTKAALDQAKTAGDGEQLKIANMNYEIEQMRLTQLRNRLERTILRAPVDGIITFLELGSQEKPVNIGDWINEFTTMVGIADPNDLLLKYNAEPSVLLGGVKVGADVDITYSGQTLKGKVTQIPGTAPLGTREPTSRMLLIEFADKPAGIEPGQEIPFELVLSKSENTLTVPRKAVRTYQGRDFVLVLEGETRKEIDVEKGIVTATQVEIKKGLEEGQQVLLNN